MGASSWLQYSRAINAHVKQRLLPLPLGEALKTAALLAWKDRKRTENRGSFPGHSENSLIIRRVHVLPDGPAEQRLRNDVRRLAPMELLTLRAKRVQRPVRTQGGKGTGERSSAVENERRRIYRREQMLDVASTLASDICNDDEGRMW
jgi:hypothetical protein